MLAAGSQPAGSANEDKPFDHILFYEPLFFGEGFFRVHVPALEKYPPAHTMDAKLGLGASNFKVDTRSPGATSQDRQEAFYSLTECGLGQHLVKRTVEHEELETAAD